MRNQRKHQRTMLSVQFKIWHDSFGEALVKTGNISDGGVYLVAGGADVEIPPVGTIIQGQVQGLMSDAPKVAMEVVRVETVGVGLKFVE